MIDLVLSKGQVFVWNAEDWLELRSNHRIIGELIGCLPKKCRQDIFNGLPMMLLPEEATLLLDKNLARLVSYPCLLEKPSESLKNALEEYRNRLFVEQEECLREARKHQVSLIMDKIVEGKRRKILGIESRKKKSMKKLVDDKTREALDNIEIDIECLMSEEMAKLPKLDKSDSLVQTHTAYPWNDEAAEEMGNIKVEEWNYPTNSSEKLRYATYKDLWERGYYISGGEKFGGDFLVYPGDPIMFHSQFIIECKDREHEIPITELAGQCRVASHVRKTFVFSTLSTEKSSECVKYQSFNWAAESNMFLQD